MRKTVFARLEHIRKLTQRVLVLTFNGFYCSFTAFEGPCSTMGLSPMVTTKEVHLKSMLLYLYIDLNKIDGKLDESTRVSR